MATRETTRKDKPAAAPKKAAPAAARQGIVAAVEPTGSSQRLLREAAWSRMFGRTEAKNPFARPR